MLTLWLVVLLFSYAILPPELEIPWLTFGLSAAFIGIIATALTWVMLWAVGLVPANCEQGEADVSDTPVHLRSEFNSDYGETRNLGLAKAMVVLAAFLSLIEIPILATVPGLLNGQSILLTNLSSIGSVMLGVICTMLVATFLNEFWPWFYVLAVTVVRLPWAFDPLSYDPMAMRHSIAMALIAMSFAVMQVFYLRAVACAGDKALNDSTAAAVRAAAHTSAAAEAARIDGLVHDHILAALLLASRADQPEDAPFIRRSAAALAALSEISSPQAEQSGQTECQVDVFAARLFHDVREEDPIIQTAGRGTRGSPLPIAVATALHAATMEAVRNSVRHADGGTGRAVIRRVTVHAEEHLVRVIVTDDGAGFDPATATKGRYDVTGSIIGRMENLDGGAAQIDSAPDEGAVITLTWNDKSAGPKWSRETVKTNMSKSLIGHDLIEQQYFSQLEGMALEAIPVGTHLRAITVMALGFLYLIVDTLDYFNPAWFSPVAALVFGVGFGVTMIPLIKDPTADPPPFVAMYSVFFAPLILAGSLWAWGSPLAMEMHNWAAMLVYLAIAGLAFSNYPRTAWAIGLSCVAVLVIWSMATTGGANLPLDVVGMLVALPFAANRMQRDSFRSLIDSATRSAEHRREANERTRDLVAFLACRQRGARVDTLARPLLERLAAGERTIASVRMEAAQLEAHLRDDLRARCFRDTTVARAANKARRAGVRVDLMDDGGLDDAPAALREQVIAAATKVLENAREGSVVVRIAPPGRDVAATILLETKVGDASQTKRLEIPARPADALVEAP